MVGLNSYVLKDNPVSNTALTKALRLDAGSIAGKQRAGVANEGYWGIPVRPETAYSASITGGAGTVWGARRAKDGHPKPFKLRFVEIGNEDWLNMGTASYDTRATIKKDATGEMLMGALGDLNTVAEPRKVVPKPLSIANAGLQFSHELPAHSVSVIRFKTR
jgi:alpha-L-arabinofuranosidase